MICSQDGTNRKLDSMLDIVKQYYGPSVKTTVAVSWTHHPFKKQLANFDFREKFMYLISISHTEILHDQVNTINIIRTNTWNASEPI